MKDKKGFTLIELLVVISIIAVLMAIMMPALGKVRQMAKLTICKTRLKNLGSATLAYAASNDNKLPIAFFQSDAGVYSSTWQSYVMKETDDYPAPRSWVNSEKYGSEIFGFGFLWQGKYLDDSEIFICPGVKKEEANRESFERNLSNFDEDYVQRLDAKYSYIPLTKAPHRSGNSIQYWKTAKRASDLSGSSAMCMDKMRGISDFYHTTGKGSNARPLINICFGDGHIVTSDNREFFTNEKVAELQALTGEAIIPWRDLFNFLDTVEK
ncbi:MAG: type II secretion system protein [Sedimentisphaeraceae bacterium JB056]